MTALTRRTLIVAAAAAPLAAGCAEATGRWESRPAIPWTVQEVYGAVWRDNILIAGGMSPSAGQVNPLARTGLFNPQLNRWNETAPLPFPRHHPAFAGADSGRYAAAGFEDVFSIGGFRVTEAGPWTAIKDVLRFDLGWEPMAPMPLFQSETVALGFNGYIHLFGGRSPKGSANASYGDHADVTTHQLYDLDYDRWTTARPCPTARNSATGGVIGKGLYVAGGRSMTGGNTGVLERYDPTTDRWDTLRPMPKPAGGLAGAVVREKLYVFGGEGGPRDNGFGGVIPDCWSYDPATDQWTAEPPMKTPRHGLAAAAFRDVIYAVGGGTKPSGGEVSAVLEAFTPGQ
jgi:hypothetical protein